MLLAVAVALASLWRHAVMGQLCLMSWLLPILRTMDVLGWVGLPPTNSSILAIYKDLNTITITSCGHY